MCCKTNALDNDGVDDLEVGQTDTFKGQQLLGDCSKVNSTVRGVTDIFCQI